MAKRTTKGVEAGAGFYILKDAEAVVTFTGGRSRDNLYSETSVSGISDFLPAKWGADNLQPQRMLELVNGNHLKPQLLYTSKDFLLGSRLSVFKRNHEKSDKGTKVRLEPIDNPEIEDWLEAIDADTYIRKAAYNFEYFHNVFTGFSLDRFKKIVEMLVWDCTDVRAKQMLSRQRSISNYYIHPDWRNVKASEVTTVPAFDRTNPTKFGDFMYHGRDWMPGQPYYDVPPYWGTREWTEVSNLIPKFHRAGLKNGYNIKYHIEIPMDYFAPFEKDEDKKKEEQRLMTVMNEMLSGVDNADKAFVTKFSTDPMGKAVPGWKITPIENKMSDDAYAKINDQANIAHTSGHGMDPSLAGIDTGGKMGGSGSEKRISYQLHLALRTPNKRKILLEPFNKVAKKIMGWDRELMIGFEDMDITTLEENPTGKQKVVNQNQ